MLERKKTINILIGAMAIAMVVTVALWYAVRHSLLARQASPLLVAAETMMLQRQLLDILTNKSSSDCAVLANEEYLRACEQAFGKPGTEQGTGTQLVPLPNKDLSAVDLKALTKQFQGVPEVAVVRSSP